MFFFEATFYQYKRYEIFVKEIFAGFNFVNFGSFHKIILFREARHFRKSCCFFSFLSNFEREICRFANFYSLICGSKFAEVNVVKIKVINLFNYSRPLMEVFASTEGYITLYLF